MRREVLLVGGPFDGTRRDVDVGARLITITWEDGPAANWPPPARQIDLASYERVDEQTFRHCRTPGGLGDDDLTIPEQRLRLEDE